MLQRPLIFAGLACLAGCGSPSPASSEAAVARVASPMIGGTRNTTEPGVVLVLIQNEANPTPETSFMCTGTVVSPHVVLTAAHCLHEDVVGKGQSFFVFYGDDVDDPVKGEDPKYFGYSKSVLLHPDFDPSKVATADAAEHDIALIVLEDAAITEPRELARDRLDQTAIGSELFELGYGKTDPKDPDTAGRRHELRTPITLLDDKYIGSEPEGKSLCEGDSGGGSFLKGADGTWRVAGVHSYVENAAQCTGKNYDARVDTHLAWIESAIRDADPGFLPEVEPPKVDGGGGEPDAAAPSAAAPAAEEKSGCSLARAAGEGETTAMTGLALVAATLLLRARRRSTRAS